MDWRGDIAALLKEKQEIDERRDGAMIGQVSYDRWVADAIEMLLMIASGLEPRDVQSEEGGWIEGSSERETSR